MVALVVPSPGRALRAGVVAALLAASTAHAQGDPLADLRASLGRFGNTAPVKAVLERAVTSERKGRPLEAGRVTLQVSAGPAGINVGYPARVLAELAAERANTDPEKAEPMRRTLENFDASDVAEMLNAVPGLLSDLDGAVLKSSRPVEFEGRAARLLELDLVVRVNQANSKWLKSSRRSMKLWTTPEGVPLAEETESAFTVGLLIFTFDAVDSRSRSFTVIGDRLVTLRRATRFEGEGLGESQHLTSETTLRLDDGG